MKSLLTITRLKGVEYQLTRIADGIEAYLRIQYNYHLTAPKPMESEGEESIEYSDDEKTTMQEAKAMIEKYKPEDEE